MAIPGNLLSATTESIDPNTSGWRAALNCTLSLGSGGRNGPGLLTMTSGASGEMQSTTVSFAQITPGTVYQTFADAGSSTQAERIGIAWYDSTSTLLSYTWSLTTTAATSVLHRVGVAGVAPAGAAYARVVLSATVTASGKTHFWENVYLGLPFRTLGNLLDFNSESGEIDTSSWFMETNCTITQDAVPWQWPVNYYYAGGEQIKMSAVAAGNASMRTNTRPPVTPGKEYLAHAYLNPSASGSACWIELRWYDSGGSQISAKRAVLAAPGTSIYQQYVSGIAPSNAASCGIAVGITSATIGQALHVESCVIQPVSAIVNFPGTVMPYEDASFEQGVGSWTVTSGVATIARTTPWSATTAVDGEYALQLTSSTATTSVLTSGRYPVTPGVNWRPKISMKSGAGTWNVVIGLSFYDASGTHISTLSDTGTSLPDDGQWWDDWDDTMSPVGAATAAIQITVTAPSAGATFLLDQVSLAQTLPALELDPDDDLGRVLVVLRDLETTDTLTLWRLIGGKQALVRGPDGLIQGLALTSSQFTVSDYEAPIGQPVSYRVEFYAADTGAYNGGQTSYEVQVNVPDPSMCWLKDPVQPQRNVRVKASAAPDWTRPSQATEFRARGRRNSVFLYDVRGGLTGTLQVWSLSDAERFGLHFATDTGNPLLLQFPPGLGFDDMYVSVGDTTEARVVPFGGDTRRLWSLSLTQVDQPIGGIVGTSGWTVRDVAIGFSTVLEAAQAYSTVLGMSINRRGE